MYLFIYIYIYIFNHLSVLVLIYTASCPTLFQGAPIGLPYTITHSHRVIESFGLPADMRQPRDRGRRRYARR